MFIIPNNNAIPYKIANWQHLYSFLRKWFIVEVEVEQKYAVPALMRANTVLNRLSKAPYQWKLSDLSKQTGISKSTLHGLLQTMEQLKWIHRDRNETYALGSQMGHLGSSYFQHYDLVEEFKRAAEPVMQSLQESVQLARLDGNEVLYLAKVEAKTPVQMVSGPGVRFPAHATGLGKSLLADTDAAQLEQIFPEEDLPKVTIHTIGSREAFQKELEKVRLLGYALDLQEGVMGFCCVSAPIRSQGKIAAAVSCSMPVHHWDEKREEAIYKIAGLAKELSN
jgi:DNA-binding IclR family transcriptional regulator